MPRPGVAAKQQSPVIVNVSPQTEQTAPEPQEDKAPLEPNWFFDKIAAITPENWGKLYTLELHRLEPKLPGVPGSKGFIDVFTEPVTRAMIKARYGGGKFRLVLVRNNKYDTSHDFDIVGEPVYVRGREMPPDSNGSGMESRLLNMLETNLKEMKDELRRRESTTGPDPAFAKAVDILSTAYSTGLNAVQKEQMDPTQLLRNMMTTAKEFGILGNGGGGTSPFMDKILEAAIPLLLGALKPKTLAEQLAEYEAMETIFGGRNGSGPRRRLGWEGIAEKAADVLLPTLADKLKEGPRQRVPMRPGAPPAQPLRPSVAPNAAAPPPAARPPIPARPAPPAAGLRVVSSQGDGRENPSVAEAVPESAAASPSVAPQVEVMPPAATEDEAYFTGVKRRVVECVANGDEGPMIVDFLEVAWPQMVNYLEVFPAQTITEFLANDPVMREAVTHKNWPRVLREAQEYLSEDLPAEPVTH